MSRQLVIIPTYNERENIENVTNITLSLEPGFDILVVDDGSPDGTAGIVKELMKEHTGRIHLLQREGKLGLGTAYIAGFKWALEHNYDYIFEMDADLSHNPQDLVRMLAELRNGYDVVVGSRYITGVNVVNWPMGRVLLSYTASKYVRTVTGMKINDATAGFVGYSRRFLSAIDLDGIDMIGYGFQIEMKYTAHRLGFKIKEIPIIFTDRTAGTSKMSGGIFGEAFWKVLLLRFRRFKMKKNEQNTDTQRKDS